MRKFLLGFMVGIILSFLFIYFGGGEILKVLGQKAIDAGERIKIYEKAFKETVGKIKKAPPFQ